MRTFEATARRGACLGTDRCLIGWAGVKPGHSDRHGTEHWPAYRAGSWAWPLQRLRSLAVEPVPVPSGFDTEHGCTATSQRDPCRGGDIAYSKLAPPHEDCHGPWD